MQPNTTNYAFCLDSRAEDPKAEDREAGKVIIMSFLFIQFLKIEQKCTAEAGQSNTQWNLKTS